MTWLNFLLLGLTFFTPGVLAQAPTTPSAPAVRSRPEGFDVATIKQVEHDAKGARFITMQGPHRFLVRDYTLKLLMAAAYNLNPKAVSGGPAWVDSAYFDITALTPGETQPSRDEQMAMLRSLLNERFKVTFHREPKEFSIYELDVAKSGPKIAPSKASPTDPSNLISTVYPQHILLPARNATMSEFVSVLQRAILDRPVVDKTGLSGRYDFDLEWAPDESQFGGEVNPPVSDTSAAPLFTAIQQQLGLKLVATRGPVETLVLDRVERPSEN